MGLILVVLPCQTRAQQRESSPIEEGYFRAVAEYFEVPPAEIEILRDWQLPPDEIPVVFFVSERAGVSTEALVAMRRSPAWSSTGGWSGVLGRYRIGVETLHVPLPQGAAAGMLQRVYDELGATPVRDWSGLELTSEEIVAFVNLHLLASVSAAEPEEILRLAGSGADGFVHVYGVLISRG